MHCFGGQRLVFVLFCGSSKLTCFLFKTFALLAYTIASTEATHLRGALRYLETESHLARWKRIGIELGLTYGDLEIIKSNDDSAEDRAVAMLHQWLTSGGATKQALVEAVQAAK